MGKIQGLRTCLKLKEAFKEKTLYLTTERTTTKAGALHIPVPDLRAEASNRGLAFAKQRPSTIHTTLSL